MTEELPKAFKIVGFEGATVPSPSAKLYNALALKAWNDYKARMELHVDHPMPDWDELPDKLKGVWLAIAHGQHGLITLLGGGKIQTIRDAKQTDENM